MASSSSSATSSPIPVVQVEQQQQDWLGALPEPILLHIVSFLPTLDAVRTSVLSTCWRNLWTSVGAIDLDEQYDREFFSRIRTITGAKRKRNRNRSRRGFVELVDKVLSFQQTPTLLKLRLIYWPKNSPLNHWVCTAVSRRVQTLDLRLPWAAIENDLLEVGGYLGNCQVKIAAPHLSSFVYRVSVAQAYVVEPLLCLEYVKIEFRGWLDKHSILDRASSFLCSLSSARNLDICPVCIKALRYKGVPFNNLNVLRAVVKLLDRSVMHVVLGLLLANQQLRALTVEVGKFSVLPSSDAGKEDFLELLGACFESGINGVLERVEITCSEYFSFASSVRYTTDAVLELVRVLLGSQGRLKKLILSNCLFCDSSYPDRRRDTVMEKVLSFPKRSTELLAVAFI